MSRVYIPAFVLMLLVIEGTLFQLLIPSNSESTMTFVPRFLIVLVVLIGIQFNRSNSLIYGLVFGLIYDIVYTQLLGIYTFGLAFIGYVFVYSSKQIQDSILIQLGIIVLAITFFEHYQYGLYRLIALTDLTPTAFYKERFVPSIIINSAFTILIYYPTRYLFTSVKRQASFRER